MSGSQWDTSSAPSYHCSCTWETGLSLDEISVIKQMRKAKEGERKKKQRREEIKRLRAEIKKL